MRARCRVTRQAVRLFGFVWFFLPLLGSAQTNRVCNTTVNCGTYSAGYARIEYSYFLPQVTYPEQNGTRTFNVFADGSKQQTSYWVNGTSARYVSAAEILPCAVGWVAQEFWIWYGSSSSLVWRVNLQTDCAKNWCSTTNSCCECSGVSETVFSWCSLTVNGQTQNQWHIKEICDGCNASTLTNNCFENCPTPSIIVETYTLKNGVPIPCKWHQCANGGWTTYYGLNCDGPVFQHYDGDGISGFDMTGNGTPGDLQPAWGNTLTSGGSVGGTQMTQTGGGVTNIYIGDGQWVQWTNSVSPPPYTAGGGGGGGGGVVNHEYSNTVAVANLSELAVAMSNGVASAMSAGGGGGGGASAEDIGQSVADALNDTNGMRDSLSGIDTNVGTGYTTNFLSDVQNVISAVSNLSTHTFAEQVPTLESVASTGFGTSYQLDFGSVEILGKTKQLLIDVSQWSTVIHAIRSVILLGISLTVYFFSLTMIREAIA